MSRDNYEVQCAISVMGGPEKVLEKAERLDEGLKSIRDQLDIQELSIVDPYMIGLYNGLLLAHCNFTGDEYCPKTVSPAKGGE